MHERVAEDEKILVAGDELDPGIRQTPLIRVYRGQGSLLRIFRTIFTSNRPKMCGELLFCVYIRLLLNRREVLEFNMEEIRAFPLAGTWRRQQSNPRSNPVNNRREIVDQTCPYCCLLSKWENKIVRKIYSLQKTKRDTREKRKSRGKHQYVSSSFGQTAPDTGGRSRTPSDCHNSRSHPEWREGVCDRALMQRKRAALSFQMRTHLFTGSYHTYEIFEQKQMCPNVRTVCIFIWI